MRLNNFFFNSQRSDFLTSLYLDMEIGDGIVGPTRTLKDFMRQDVLDRIAQIYLPPLHETIPCTPAGFEKMNMGKGRIQSGTTILAFRYNGGVIMAADRKTSVGFSIKTLDTVKIHQIAGYTAIGCAGFISDIQFTLEKLKDVNISFRSRYGKWLTIEGQVNYLVNLLRDSWQDLSFLVTDSIIVGRSFFGEVKIHQVTRDGCSLELSYIADGSGGDDAESVLFDSRKQIGEKSLSLDDGIKLALRAIFKSGAKDNFSSDLRVSYPSIAVITANDEFRFVEDGKVREEADLIIREEELKDGKK